MTDLAEHSSRSTATLLTAGGRGAVATIRYAGDVRLIDAADPPLFRAVSGRPLVQQPLGRVVFGHWGAAAPEEIVVCRIAGDALELHCHGGETPVRRILDDLRRTGCEVVPWKQAVARQEGTLAAEFAESVAAATTFRTAEILLEQQSGILRTAVEELLSEQPAEKRIERIEALLRWSDVGLHLTRPWSVVLAGRPNVGKSSLINALLGYARSIVYDEPGTTRDVVTAQSALEGWPVEFADTAGIRDQAEELESAGILRARRMLAEADARVVLIDLSAPPQADDRMLLAEWPDATIVAHKADLPDAWSEQIPAGALRVSSVTAAGVDELARTIVSRLVPEVPPAGTAIPFTMRQIALLQSARAALVRGELPQFRRAVEAYLS